MRLPIVAAMNRTPLARPLRAGAHAAREAQMMLRPRHVATCTRAYALERLARRRYRVLDEAELRATRSSDTVFVIGAGRSLVDIDEATWGRIAGHDTLAFSHFFRQTWIGPRYYMIGEVSNADEFGAGISENPLFADTILVMQKGWRAHRSNELLGRRLVPEGTRIFRYRRTSRGVYAPPSTSFRRGVVHGWNSSISTTNLALLMGWRRIVLTGIDLYNKEYFWLPAGVRRPDEREGLDASSPFPSAASVIDLFGRWRRLLEPQGIRLEVYNPRSLLAAELDVFAWDS